MADNFLANLSHYVPELVVLFVMMGLLILEATYRDKEKRGFYVLSFVGLGLVAALGALFAQLGVAPLFIFTHSIAIDPFSTVLKIVMVLGTLGTIFVGWQSRDIYSSLKSDFIVMILGVLIGGMLLASANNMLTVYLGVETLSVLSYVLASFKKNDERSAEAGIKYVLYGGVSAGLMLYGISHIYGIVGTIHFAGLPSKLASLPPETYLILIPSFLMFFVGIGYKIACVPFHMWSPDVYEGSPLPVTTFFAIIPKVAGLAVLTRVTFAFFGQEGVLQSSWVGLLQVIAALTMTVGNVSAIGQKSVKRMLAYSSIAHAGTMLLGILVVGEVGVTSLVFYIVTYLFMTLVAFYVTSFVSDIYGNDHFERFSGLLKRYPLAAISMIIVMFSLGGLPPFSGFVAKFNIFSAVISKGYYTLALIAAINSVVSLYYYMRLVRLMVFKSPESVEKMESFNFLNQAVVIALTFPVIFLGIFWEKLMAFSSGAKILLQ